ncbi:MAG TPA: lysophospholipid acyltransferase family protein [Thermoanaerobaculia bacterium]|nr:lysophospholipid acyltransferase family protein [Thermoanaerobaculia bacterium]
MKRRKNPLLERAEYAVYRMARALLGGMSDAAVQRWGSRLGAASAVLIRKRDRMAMRNLRLAFPHEPEHELRRILDACWRHMGREVAAHVKAQTFTREEILSRCDVTGKELVDESVARGKGTIIMTAHFGSWEIAGLATSALIPNIKTIYRPLDNRLLERDLARLRETTGLVVIDRKGAARELMRTLSENGIIGLLPDQAVLPREGVLATFMGRKAWTTPLPAKLALRHGSTIVFVFCIPDGLRYRLRFEEPIRADELSEAERDPVALTERINDVISRQIRARPELWLWMHDRWKGTGNG